MSIELMIKSLVEGNVVEGRKFFDDIINEKVAEKVKAMETEVFSEKKMMKEKDEDEEEDEEEEVSDEESDKEWSKKDEKKKMSKKEESLKTEDNLSEAKNYSISLKSSAEQLKVEKDLMSMKLSTDDIGGSDPDGKGPYFVEIMDLSPEDMKIVKAKYPKGKAS